MRRHTFFLAATLISGLIVGCGSHASKLIGDWNTDVPGIGTATMSYAADGSMSMIGDFSPAGKDAKMVISGTWSEAGDKVHMTYTDVKFTGLPPAMQAKESSMADGAKKAVGVGTDNIMIVKYDGDDAFSLTDGKGEVSNFKRKGK